MINDLRSSEVGISGYIVVVTVRAWVDQLVTNDDFMKREHTGTLHGSQNFVIVRS